METPYKLTMMALGFLGILVIGQAQLDPYEARRDLVGTWVPEAKFAHAIQLDKSGRGLRGGFRARTQEFEGGPIRWEATNSRLRLWGIGEEGDEHLEGEGEYELAGDTLRIKFDSILLGAPREYRRVPAR